MKTPINCQRCKDTGFFMIHCTVLMATSHDREEFTELVPCDHQPQSKFSLAEYIKGRIK